MRLFANTDIKTYEKQSKVALEGLVAELPNLIVTLLTAIFSNTLLVWSDCIVSFESSLHYFLVFSVSTKLKKETGERYNFGVERLEAFTSFICDLLIIMGFLIIVAVSIYGIINPSQPADALGYFLILKVSNISFDAYFYINQLKISKKHINRINDTEKANCLNNLLVDISTGTLACLCFFLRSYRWSWYISPIVSLVMAIIFFYQCIQRIKASIADLSDVSIPISEQDELFDIVLEDPTLINKVNAVNCRMLNRRLYVEINLVFKEDTTYAEQSDLLKKISSKIEVKFPNSTTRFVIENQTKQYSKIKSKDIYANNC